MSLSDSQQLSVSTWIQQGKSLADVQRLLREEFSISMTYMDVRFLVDDLDIVLSEPEADESAEGDVKAETAEEAELVEDRNQGVTVDVDVIMRPGTLVSGNVTFSDGVTLGWQLSSAGQLGLVPGDNPEYRPSPDDVQEFQAQLQTVLQQKGY
jgi:hypothetical protein